MEKQIETVYVPTDEAPYFIVKDVEKEFIKARVTEQEAYLYTPEEHAAVQEALLEEFTKGVKAGLESPNAAAALFHNAADKGDSLDELKEQIESWLESNHFSLGGDQKYIDVRELLPFIKSLKP